MYQRRVVGLVLAITAGATILATLFGRWWWIEAEDDGAVHIGLRSAEVCQRSHDYDLDFNSDASSYLDSPSHSSRRHSIRCHDGSLRTLLDGELDDRARRRWDDDGSDSADDEPEHVGGAFIVVGWLAFVTGLGACIALVVAAATSGGPARPRPAAYVAAIACGAYAALSLAFLVAAPSMLTDNLRAGPGLALALVGAIAGVAGALCLGRSDPAREPTGAALADADRAAPVGRAPALIAGAIGATLILVSLFTDLWFHGTDEETKMSVGLQEVELCHHSDADDDRDTPCQTQTIPPRVDHDERHPTRFKIFLASGTTTLWTGIAASLGFAVIAVLLLFRQGVGGRFGMPVALFSTSGGFALSTLVYTIAFPGDEIEHLSLFLGPFLALGGAGCLVGAGVMVRRWMQSLQMSIPSGVTADPSQPTFAPGGFGGGLLVPAGAFPPPPGAFPPPPGMFPPPPPPPLAPTIGNVPPNPYAPSPFAPPAPPLAAIPAPPPYAPIPPPAPAVVIPACPRCATPMLWVSAKSSWLCTVCKNLPAE